MGSRDRDDNRSSTSSDEKSTQKMEQTDEEMYQTVLARHNNYDLRPYFTEATNQDTSPQMIKSKSKNQKFSDFQKHLNSKIGLKSRETRES